MNTNFSNKLIEKTTISSFGSVGVFQELLKEICIEAGILDDTSGPTSVDNPLFLEKAIKTKTTAYSGRHQRALESIASGLGPTGLMLPHYLVIALLSNGFNFIEGGISREELEQKIIHIHPLKDEVTSNITAFLNSLSELQHKKNIKPPILGYDSNIRLLQVVDSTFNFFMKNTNLKSIKAEIIKNKVK